MKSDSLLIQRKHPKSKIPTRGSKLAAGYNLYSCKTAIVPTKSKAIVSTGISVCIPIETYGCIAPRSGLAVKHSIDIGAGVVDTDYQGIINVVLLTMAKKTLKIIVFSLQI